MTKNERRYWLGAIEHAEKQGYGVGGIILVPRDENNTSISLKFALPPEMSQQVFVDVMRAFFSQESGVTIKTGYETPIPESEGNV